MDERSIEEQDHLERSTKKIKAKDLFSTSSSRSYKESLLKPPICNDLFQGFILVEEDDDDLNSNTEKFSDEFTSIQQWKWIENGNIIYKNHDEEFDCVDLGHGFYVVKFSSLEDIQKWNPNFNPATRMITSTTVWIQLSGLPLEYFNEVLVKVGKLVGRPIKLDSNTTYTTRGKFARICIEIDLSKPLIPLIRIEACVLKKVVTNLKESLEAVQTKNTKATSEKKDKATKGGNFGLENNTLEMAKIEINNDRPKDLRRFNSTQAKNLEVKNGSNKFSMLPRLHRKDNKL
ncbi:hypothetical protein CXB51_008208 [Gossypium anomalum]|uniref:DUF4283 domain-containing protein n=1 Tax=Gossypium anomalum TaxID=47600 RepID=A0A8J5ZEW0_9ROSI|nr:hypothetical protein CXB51_008208 [Gossypium anomalum]